ncbi:MAG: hypothetical protein Q9164_007425, partial [Protoblastenia rupestris]
RYQGLRTLNWGYELVGLVIDQVAKEGWASVLREKILEPLGMTRSGAETGTGADNRASAYVALVDSPPSRVQDVKLSEHTLMGPAGGIRSCVTDILRFYQNLLECLHDQSDSGKNYTLGSPLKQVRQLLSPHMCLPEGTYQDSFYGLGWALTDLPAPMGAIGLNPDLLDEMPVGSIAGALSAVNLFPETQSGIVVLSNTLGLNDCPDWVAQMLTEALFESKDPHDFVAWAKASANSTRRWEGRIREKLDSERTPGTSPRPLEEYTGQYFNSLGNMFIEVKFKSDRLSIAFQGLEVDEWYLDHFEFDTFIWLPTFTELAGSGREALHKAEYFKMRFMASGGNNIDSLFWRHDEEIEGGERFTKKNQDADKSVFANNRTQSIEGLNALRSEQRGSWSR